ncbi:hypothetical protein Tco_1493330 [Tanacetum coccineum]
MKRANTFVDYRTELVEGSLKKAEAEIVQESSSKRAGDELEQESVKKQKVDEDKEIVELKSIMQVIPDEEEVAINAIPLATKPPTIIDWKIHKEGKNNYYQIIRADGSSKMYMERIIGIKRLLDDLRVTAAKVCVTAAELKSQVNWKGGQFHSRENQNESLCTRKLVPSP